MVRFLALLCCLAALFPPGVATAEPAEQISKWSPGKRIEVTRTNGDKFVGRLGPITANGFTLNPDKRERVLRARSNSQTFAP